MQSISANSCAIHFNEHCFSAFNQHLKSHDYSIIFILVDSNTHEHCLPIFLAEIETNTTIEIIEIEPGEQHKTIDTCVGVWNALSELGGDRKSFMVNLGGGVVTDLGGVVACTFKRGIDYVNVPTSLLSMVDASVGGKTGVDLGALKNQVGVIDSGAMVLVDTIFLKTLPKNQMVSGFAEMLKHGLISSRDYWNELVSLKNIEWNNLDELIHASVKIKRDIVVEDPFERNIRKHLNFGHTLGHAIESHFLINKDEELLHGEAIAIGMILEAYLSVQLVGFDKADLDVITRAIHSIYKPVELLETDHAPIMEFLKHDKKNEYGNIKFVLLEAIGKPKINCEVPHDLIIEAFDHYRQSLPKV